MARVRVTCINKLPDGNSHQNITHFGNAAADWRWTRDQIIEDIEAGIDTFFAINPATARIEEILVVRPSEGLPYLRAQAEGRWTDSLLYLGECPPSLSS